MKFPDLTSERIHQLDGQQKEAFLNCYQVFQNSQKSSADTINIKCRLELFRGFLVVRYNSQERHDIGFTCDYNIKFQLKRLNPMTQSKVGKATGVIFTYEIYDNVSNESSTQQTEENKTMKLEFQALEHDGASIQNFARALEKQYIVQKGFHECFRAIKRIGKGISACVYSAVSFIENKQVAVKSFRRSVYFASDNGNGKKAFQKEFKILTELNHPNVCKSKGVFQTDNSTYVVLELLSMSLFAFLQKYGFPKGNIAKKIMKGLLEGIKYIHDKGIMHRDLKLENIMVKDNDKNNVKPVIVDLGLAQYTSSTQYLYTRCGTPGYVAPEVLMIKSDDVNKTYTTACDMFSLGVIFHILLLQRSVFEGTDVREVIKKNCQCNIDFSNERFEVLGDSGKDFLKRLLQKDPLKRMNANQALQHPYLIEINQGITTTSIRNVSSNQSIAGPIIRV